MSAKISLVDMHVPAIVNMRTIKVNAELVSGIAMKSLQEVIDQSSNQVTVIQPNTRIHDLKMLSPWRELNPWPPYTGWMFYHWATESTAAPTQRPQVRIPLKPRKTFFSGYFAIA